jgi:hypothetical protein
MMWFYLFFLTLLLPQLLFSQGRSFQHITVVDGLSNNFVRTIHKDQFGFIWFGTLDGLDRFDGEEIRSFSDRFPDGHQRVNSLIDHHGNGLWIGTDKGLRPKLWFSSSTIFRVRSKVAYSDMGFSLFVGWGCNFRQDIK